MPNTDLQDQILSHIAYWDIDDDYEWLTSQDSSYCPSMSMLLSEEEKTILVNEFDIDRATLDTMLDDWRVVGVENNYDTQFKALVIQSNSTGEASVAFRGTLFFSSETMYTSWTEADFQLLSDTCTAQQHDVDVLLDKYNGFFRECGYVNYAGHSLGGNLTEYAGLMTEWKYAGDFNYYWKSLDGPGFNNEFLNGIPDYVQEGAYQHGHHYTWSLVGNCLSHGSGYQNDYLAVQSGECYHRYGLAFIGYKHFLYFVQCNRQDGSFIIDNSQQDSFFFSWEKDWHDFTVNADNADWAQFLFGTLLHLPAYNNLSDDDKALLNNALKYGVVHTGGVIATGVMYVYEVLNGTRYDVNLIRSTEYIASFRASLDPKFYIEIKNMNQLVNDCNQLVLLLDEIKHDIDTPVSIPSYSTTSSYSDPVISSLLTAMANVYSAFETFKAKLTMCSSKAGDVLRVAKNTRTYVSNTAHNFQTMEYQNILDIQNWKHT